VYDVYAIGSGAPSKAPVRSWTMTGPRARSSCKVFPTPGVVGPAHTNDRVEAVSLALSAVSILCPAMDNVAR
jgi:hypothetical protein